MTTLKNSFFILLVPGFLLGVVPVFVIPKIPGTGLPAGFWYSQSVPRWLLCFKRR